MSWPRVLAARVRGLVFRGRLDSQLEDELRFHLEMQAEDNIRIGMNPSEARYDAMRRFGGMQSVKEEYRESRTFAAVETLFRDVRYAARALRRNPGFTAVAVMTLALGIGINAAVFTVTNAVLFKGFSNIERSDRILYMTNSEGCCVSYPDFEDWRAQAKSFQGMAIVHGVQVTLSDKGGFPEYRWATEVSANTFRLVGQLPMIGRDFTRSDETPGAAPVAILNNSFWESRFGKDPDIVGRTVRLNGAPATVIGVMPSGFFFPQNQDLWVPLVPTPHVMKRANRDTWFVFGRMVDGATIEGARAEMETIGKRLEQAYPLTNKGFPPVVRNFAGFYIGPDASLLYGSLWGAVGFVLLIACANLANLLLARALGRSREISVRMALGAGRWRVVRQLFIESSILSALGGFLGWWIAKWGVRAWDLASRPPGYSWIDHVLDYTLDYRVFAYLIAISAGTGLLFGLAPALRLSKLDVNSTLKDGGRGSTGGVGGNRLSALLVVAEMALAVILLASAGVMIRSYMNTYSADIGVQPEKILTGIPSLPASRYPDATAQISFYDRLETRLEAVPGVESVALASTIPMMGGARLSYELDGAAPVDEQSRPMLSSLTISPGYFRTLGAAVLSGRDFNSGDGSSGPRVAIVNQRFARRFWPGENPLGKRFRLFVGNTPEVWLTVVGVASNILQSDIARPELNSLVYLPWRQTAAGNMNVLVRTSVPPGSLRTTFRNQVHAVDSDLPMFGPFTLIERLQTRYWDKARYAVLFLIFAAVALLLASVGLYAVIAHSVSRRTQELGIRMALGAVARDILSLVFREGMLPVGIGLAIGLALSVAVNRVLKAELVQVSPGDPAALVVSSAALILSAALGCWIPARRAMRVDPAVALRHD
jgi:putative ABC transport system permease protein